jgi:hypothetical protein
MFLLYGCGEKNNMSKKYQIKYGRHDVLGLSQGHDVVICSEPDKHNKVKVKTLTSLEHFSKNGERFFDYKALDKASKGIIDPIPNKAVGSKHWGGIYQDSRLVDYDDLSNSHNCWKNKISKKYRKLVG